MEATGETLSLAAAEIAGKVDRSLEGRVGDLRVAARAPVFRGQDVQAMTRLLQEIKADFAPAYVWLGMADAHGRITATTDQASLGRDMSQTPWFRAERDGAPFYVGDVEPFEELDGLEALAIAVRVTGPEGEFVGVVTARLSLATLEDVLTQTIRTFRMRPDLSGRVDYQFFSQSGVAFIDSESVRSGRVNLLQLGLPSARLSESGRPGYVEEEDLRRRIPVITGYARTHGVGYGTGVQWGILVHMDRRDVLGPIRSDLMLLGGLALLLWGPLVGLLLWAARALVAHSAHAQEREAWLATTLDGIGDGVIATDRQGKVLFMNPVAQTLTGWRQQDAKGRCLDDVFRIINEESRQPVDNPVSKVLRHGLVVGLANHTILIARNGTERSIDDSGAPIRNAQGLVVGVVLVFREITERRKAERHMQAEHTVTRLLSESGTLAEAAPKILETVCRTLAWDVGLLWVMDQATRHLRCVHSWHDAFRLGTTVTAFLQDSRHRTFAPGVGLPGRVWAEGRAVWIADVARDPNFPREPAAAEAGFHGAFGFPIQRGHDVSGVLEFFSRMPRPPDEDLLAMMTAIGHQIGQFIERKEAERALAAETMRLDVTLRSIGDGVIATDAEGRILLLNAVAERLTGWTQEEAKGQPLSRVFHIVDEATRRPCVNPVEQALLTGNVVDQADHRLLIAKDGAERLLADSGAPIRAHDGTILGVVLVFRDVTEKLKVERESLVAGKLESVGILAGGIAHDFNNILTAILGNLSLAKRGVDPEDKLFRRLSEAESATLRATGLTQQLLTFSKGGEPVKKSSAIGALLPEWAGFALRGGKVHCDYALPADLWAVEIDEGQISQVVHNLVLNAQQAMPEGGVVTISGENLLLSGPSGRPRLPLKEGRYVKIAIRDQGVGIAPEHLAKIFDPYFTTKKTGSGLGLATSFTIVKNHEGHMTVESQLGVGTTFAVYLPAASVAAPTPEERAQQVMRGWGRVLVMDDEAVIRAVSTDMLAQCGYEATEASEGAQALQLYRQARDEGRPFDAIIVDLTIPGGMGGLEAIERLLVVDPQAKAIVSSGYATDPVMANFLQYGFRGVITKPYELVEFSRVLYRVVMESRR